MIGCECPVCQSDDPRDKRTRPALLIEAPAGNILVDAGPDLRMQMLAARVKKLDACIITHDHADHIFGLDDLRQFNFLNKVRIPVYATRPTLERLRSVFSYCFQNTQEGGGKPQLDLMELDAFTPITLCGLDVLPLWHWHGQLPVTSLLLGGKFAYVTDVSAIPAETRPHLQGRDSLVLGAVRYEPHPTHFHLQGALDEAQALGVRQTYLTHLSHHFCHATASETLPQGVTFAHDGLRLEFSCP